MAFLDQWKLANFVDGATTPDAEDFRRRVWHAIVKVATQIAGEAPSASSAKDEKRAALATNVLGTQILTQSDGSQKALSGGEIWLDTFANAVVTNATIAAASTDADIEFTVSSLWDDVAGVTGRDT